MASASADRRRAARLLIRVEDGAFASRLLVREASPGIRTRVLGTQRWRRWLDHRLEPFLNRPLDRLDPEVRAVLRLGCFEGARLGVPAPVATDAMIRLVRQLGKSSASGMVNAVLRRALAADPPETGSPGVRWSHPEWLWERWSSRWGEQSAIEAMASAQEPAPPWVWFPSAVDREELVRTGVELRAHPWCCGAWTADRGRSTLMDLVARGGAVVQDPSSQLVARLAVGLTGGGGRAVDLCAAPGGKAALMRQLGDWDLLVAADLSPAKARRLAERVAPLPVFAGDAARPAVVERFWDLVVVDAPCSGTGTLRRHPELKWRLGPDAILDAAALQRRLVAAAATLVKPGGVLVYATCSVEPEENEAHFERLPDGYGRLRLDDHLPEALPWVETAGAGVRILPHDDGDGFTVHAVRRHD